jgi:hypothetical protein
MARVLQRVTCKQDGDHDGVLTLGLAAVGHEGDGSRCRRWVKTGPAIKGAAPIPLQ